MIGSEETKITTKTVPREAICSNKNKKLNSKNLGTESNDNIGDSQKAGERILK